MQRMLLSFVSVAVALFGCARSNPDTTAPAHTETQRIVLYTSVDDELARSIIERFEKETGVTVDILGDTEATKTTGLVTRLMSEKDSPRCDVWWSSEPMGTILLGSAGVLEPGAMRESVAESWPSELRARDWSWVGTALRSRVVVYAPGRVDEPPTSMHELMDPKYKGRLGMARPQFGTTRFQMVMLAGSWDLKYFEEWLEALKANGVRLYDGNATVVRAVAMGEIDVGLTDSDDVWSGQKNKWDVEIARSEREPTDIPPASRFYLPVDRILIPNTVAVVRGAPNPELARQLAAYLTSPAVERLLYESSSGNHPVNAALRRELGLPELVSGFGGPSLLPEYEGISAQSQQAIDACDRVLGP